MTCECVCVGGGREYVRKKRKPENIHNTITKEILGLSICSSRERKAGTKSAIMFIRNYWTYHSQDTTAMAIITSNKIMINEQKITN